MRFFERIFYLSNIFNSYCLTIAGGNNQPANILNRKHTAYCAQRKLKLPLIHLAARKFLIFLKQSISNLSNRDTLIFQKPIRINRNLNCPLPATHNRDRPNPSKCLKIFFNRFLGNMSDFSQITIPRYR